ncbi:hypothetical protein PGT21_004748 [Puccinia graminis f. sp. tritici]|uniref:Uncharacterized protein n=1 Tax=Puccinia graminis f. sp. tritici TaxID=56615 RepID=A0A5B0M1N7_PUCGR|nr:hypothetical protein PGT21_004748 [Puccinia graminis f. sp. tritici]
MKSSIAILSAKVLVSLKILNYFGVSAHPISSSKHLFRRGEEILKFPHCKCPHGEAEIENSDASKIFEDVKGGHVVMHPVSSNPGGHDQIMHGSLRKPLNPQENSKSYESVDLEKFNTLIETLDKNWNLLQGITSADHDVSPAHAQIENLVSISQKLKFIAKFDAFLKTLTESQKEILLQISKWSKKTTLNEDHELDSVKNKAIHLKENVEDLDQSEKKVSTAKNHIWVVTHFNKSQREMFEGILKKIGLNQTGDVDVDPFKIFSTQQLFQKLILSLDDFQEEEDVLTGIQLFDLYAKLYKFEQAIHQDFHLTNLIDEDDYELYQKLIKQSMDEK